jgi:hypothetical protein
MYYEKRSFCNDRGFYGKNNKQLNPRDGSGDTPRVDIMYSEFPSSVCVDSVSYPIDTDFRLMMQFELYAQKDDKKGIAETLTKFYKQAFPPDPNKAVSAMIGFYLCGGELRSENPHPSQPLRRCYAFDEDSRYIIAAFRQQYNIDLVHSSMHWWEFSALFAGLTDSTEFVKIMQYRCTDTRKIKNDAEKARIKRLQQRYALSENKIKHYANVKERDADMIAEMKKQLLRGR